MKNFSLFKELIGKKIKRLYLYVWPPLLEESMLAVDMAIGVEFKEDLGKIYKISISKDDGWTPELELCEAAETYDGSLFEERLNSWMSGDINEIKGVEIFDISRKNEFASILGSSLSSVELIMLKGGLEPFGVKLNFEQDFIFVTPICDGSTVETSIFNNLNNFKSLGDFEFVEINKALELLN